MGLLSPVRVLVYSTNNFLTTCYVEGLQEIFFPFYFILLSLCFFIHSLIHSFCVCVRKLLSPYIHSEKWTKIQRNVQYGHMVCLSWIQKQKILFIYDIWCSLNLAHWALQTQLMYVTLTMTPLKFSTQLSYSMLYQNIDLELIRQH